MSKLELDEKIVRKLSELLQEMGLTEIEYEASGHRIRVARGAAPQMAAPVVVPQAAAPGPAGEAPSSGAAEAVPANAVTAPMVGTTYVAPEPGAAAFLSVGDSVKEARPC